MAVSHVVAGLHVNTRRSLDVDYNETLNAMLPYISRLDERRAKYWHLFLSRDVLIYVEQSKSREDTEDNHGGKISPAI